MTNLTNNETDFSFVVFKLNEGVIYFNEKDVNYYKELKGIKKDTTVIVKRNDGTEDWY